MTYLTAGLDDKGEGGNNEYIRY